MSAVRVLVWGGAPSTRRLAVQTAGRDGIGECVLYEPGNSAAPGLRDLLSGVDAALVSIDEDESGPGVAGIERLRAEGFSGIIVATTARGSIALATEAMRRGADDVLPKPFAREAMARRLTMPRPAAGPAPQPAPAAQAADFETFIGRSEAMRAVYDAIARVAPSRAPVFITGESGTGKELAAEAIHARSGREGKPFVALNCGAMPKDLIEAEIFGAARGAFTGAVEDRAGAAEQADGGTLFLDEIGEMELGLQAKLLRFVQTGTVRRVGEGRLRKVDVRIVCATNRDPAAEVKAGRFREDLFYRLWVLPIHLPRLAEREGDVLRLAEHFLLRFSAEEKRRFRAIAPAAASLLAAHAWPGNVRELENLIRRIVVLEDRATLDADLLAELAPAGDRAPAAILPFGPRPVLETGPDLGIEPFHVQEQRIIETALARCGGNTARAAAALGLSPSTIYRKRQAWLPQGAA